ncbi:hypothetical protein [Desulfallas sp. Bu1-1]|jgi:hypothetical protein|nr:hypothetical protein [Desulfallas sp. Bu1-1]
MNMPTVGLLEFYDAQTGFKRVARYLLRPVFEKNLPARQVIELKC